jgi:hypothetical protein
VSVNEISIFNGATVAKPALLLNLIAIAVLILHLLMETAHAEDIIVFECQSGAYWAPEGKVLVEASIFPGSEFGLVQVAGKDYLAIYELKGFNHRWDFGSNVEENGFEYSFVIKPDGTGLYIDFSNAESGKLVRPSQLYICKQTEL